MAAGAGFLEIDLNLLLAAKNSLLKGNPHGGPHIGAPHGAVVSPGGPAGAENIAEDIAENVAHIPGEVESAEPTGSGSGARVKRSMAELVVLLTLLRIAEHTVSLGSFLKFGLCLLVPRVRIRMVLFGQSSVCFF